MMKNDDFKSLKGFADGRTDICDCRVAFATENLKSLQWWWEVGTIDSTLVLRLGLDWTGLGLGLDN